MVIVDIPDTTTELHPKISLSAEYLFVQGITILHSISSRYGFHTVEHLKDYKKKFNEKSMLNGVKNCINIYHANGLTVERLNTDNKCTCIRNEMIPTQLNMIGAEEHVRNAEISVRTGK